MVCRGYCPPPGFDPADLRALLAGAQQQHRAAQVREGRGFPGGEGVLGAGVVSHPLCNLAMRCVNDCGGRIGHAGFTQDIIFVPAFSNMCEGGCRGPL